MSKVTRFNDTWLFDPAFSSWIAKDTNYLTKFRCCLCGGTYELGNMGRTALISHARGKKHTSRVELSAKAKKGQHTLAAFWHPGTEQSDGQEASTSHAPMASATSIEQQQSNKPNTKTAVKENQGNHLPSPEHRQAWSTYDAKGASSFVSRDSVLTAEILWAIKSVMNHYSCSSSTHTDKFFQRMFPDSQIAQKFACGQTKCSYLIRFGLAPYFEREVLDIVTKTESLFVVSFDESFNKIIQQEQMDLILRFWDEERKQVVGRYFDSQFLGHTRAVDLLSKFKSGLSKLHQAGIVQISMDGPATNWSFFEKLLQERAESDPDLPLLINLGSCGLHVVHGGFKSGVEATGWKLDSLLRSMFYLLRDSPARRDDFTTVTGSTLFPLKFCGTRWLEDVPVAERALQIWNHISKYAMTTAAGPKSKVPKIQSFNNVMQHIQDPLTPAKLHFFVCIAKILTPFLQKFQTDKPMAPFLGEELLGLLKTIMAIFIKKSVMDQATTAAKLAKIDIEDAKNQIDAKKMELGFAVKAEIDKVQKEKAVSSLQIYSFQMECRTLLAKLTAKLLERCPLKYPIVRHLVALDPRNIAESPENACEKMNYLLTKLMSLKWLSADQCDEALREFKKLVEDIRKYHKQEAQAFKPTSDRIDIFYSDLCTGGKDCYKVIWKVIKMMLILSHGQSDIERGFSVNKDIARANMKEETIVAYRKVYDGVKQRQCSVHEFPVNPLILDSCRHARSRFQIHLDETKKAETESIAQKRRKEIEADLKDSKTKKQKLEVLVKQLCDEADTLSTDAEKKNKMSILVKANALREKAKQKSKEVDVIAHDIKAAEKKLKNM